MQNLSYGSFQMYSASRQGPLTGQTRGPPAPAYTGGCHSKPRGEAHLERTVLYYGIDDFFCCVENIQGKQHKEGRVCFGPQLKDAAHYGGEEVTMAGV